MSYLAILAVVLVLLNSYPLIVSQDLLFSSKQDSLKSQTAVMSSALMELEQLTSEQVVRVMTMLDSMGLERILVTDPAGLILYDSDTQADTTTDQTTGKYALVQEVVLALEGNDVFHTNFEKDTFFSTAARPHCVSRHDHWSHLYL